jgi:kynurenine formamidase
VSTPVAAVTGANRGIGRAITVTLAAGGFTVAASPTPDNPASTSYPCHMMCRREHITHYENLANLDQVVNTRFTFAGFPLKLVGAHGGPTRAVALVG